MNKFYILTGSVFSFVYVLAGILLILGKLNFDFQPNVRIALGSGICAYGIFRVYMFYRRMRAAREEDENQQ
jgi:hypothetical protein